MFDKFFSAFKLASDFKGLIFTRLSSPLQSAKIASFFWDLKGIFKAKNDTSEMIGKVLDKVVEFKKENPETYKELFVILDELLENYEKNPSEIKKNIKQLLS